MFRLVKTLSSYGAAAVTVAAVGVIMLATPRAAHAIAATLVQVTNTASNPAIAQSPNTQASQLVHLFAGYVQSGTSPSLASNPLSTNFFNIPFTVPANQSLVVTSVDITPTCSSTFAVSLFGLSEKTWNVTGPNTAHFEYPSGFVIGPGITPSAFVQFGTSCIASFDVNGYLTSN